MSEEISLLTIIKLILNIIILNNDYTTLNTNYTKCLKQLNYSRIKSLSNYGTATSFTMTGSGFLFYSAHSAGAGDINFYVDNKTVSLNTLSQSSWANITIPVKNSNVVHAAATVTSINSTYVIFVPEG